jgi:hypothetical protein
LGLPSDTYAYSYPDTNTNGNPNSHGWDSYCDTYGYADTHAYIHAYSCPDATAVAVICYLYPSIGCWNADSES